VKILIQNKMKNIEKIFLLAFISLAIIGCATPVSTTDSNYKYWDNESVTVEQLLPYIEEKENVGNEGEFIKTLVGPKLMGYSEYILRSIGEDKIQVYITHKTSMVDTFQYYNRSANRYGLKTEFDHIGVDTYMVTPRFTEPMRLYVEIVGLTFSTNDAINLLEKYDFFLNQIQFTIQGTGGHMFQQNINVKYIEAMLKKMGKI
jgi:hypothetical protein